MSPPRPIRKLSKLAEEEQPEEKEEKMTSKTFMVSDGIAATIKIRKLKAELNHEVQIVG